jgi:GT2 family glycosyltransferase
VLTLDDDIVPVHDLVQKHAAAHGDPNVWAVVGQVLQPGQVPEDHIVGPPDEGLLTHLEFRFNSTRRCLVRNGMSGNMSIRRDRAIQIGGFDENFCYTVAYRFETEFGRRIWKRGGKILFEPEASIRHLRVVRGGTRTGADHLRSHQPDHSIGDYYFALQHGLNMESIRYISHRFLRSVCTRFHLRHPWWIPPKLLGELRGLIGAVRLVRQGPKLLQIKDS